MTPWAEYIKAVRTGKRTVGHLERFAVEHVSNLSKRYFFDEDEAWRVVNLVHRFRHTKGKWAGVPFNLMPHQAFFFAYLFGLKREDGTRLIREAMQCMAKKGGKSEIAGAIAVLMTYFDGEQTAECYAVANKVEQALYCWTAAKKIAQGLAAEYPDFESRFKFYDNQQMHVMKDTLTDSFFKAIPTDGKTLDGVNPHFAVIDEYHEAQDTSIPDNMVSGMVLREQPLLLFVTTRGFHPYGPLSEKEDYYLNVLRGHVDDPTVFPLIHSLDDDDNWKDPSVWIKSNPGLGTAPTSEALQAEQTKAIEEGGARLVSCLTKNFNIWQRAQTVYVDPVDWDKGDAPIDETELHGRKCFAAFDIGQTNDLSALGYLFPPIEPGDKFVFICRFFMPHELVTARSREHKVSYRQWIEQGWVITTPGNITDTRFIMDQIRTDFRLFAVEKIGADKAFALELLNTLLAESYPVVDFPQRYGTMNAPVLKIPQLAAKGELQHGGNRPLAWMASNVALRKNTGGQVMMDKSDRITAKGKDAKRGKKKIDGMVVLAMCLGLYMDSLNENNDSVYNSDEIEGLLIL